MNLSTPIAAPLHLDISEGGVHAGFPSPADDYLEQQIDLNAELVPRPASTFLCRVKGHSLKDIGIEDGDLLVIDKSIRPKSGMVAVCYVDGEFTVKQLRVDKEGITLLPANPDFPAIPVSSSSSFSVFGVVTWSIHKYGKDVRAR